MNSPIKFFLDMHEVCIATTLSETTIQKLIREGQFPKPRLLGGRRLGWLVDEVKEWACARPVSDLLPPPNTGGRKPKPKQKELEAN